MHSTISEFYAWILFNILFFDGSIKVPLNACLLKLSNSFLYLSIASKWVFKPILELLLELKAQIVSLLDLHCGTL